MMRRAGLLLHPTSFPGPGGIGTLGHDAFATLDWMASAGLSAWQLLPLGPTGYGDSPYQSFSAFAGNPYLISLELLAEQHLLTEQELAEAHAGLDAERVDFGALIPRKLAALTTAEAALWSAGRSEDQDAVSAFADANQAWLDDYALFMALKEAHGGGSWNAWPAALRDRDPKAVHAARETHAHAIRRHVTWQAWFAEQWTAVRDHAHALDLEIIGDLPIFVAYDSADVWTNRSLFDLAEDGSPNHVAGVPPDYFSATGQRWGNPLYRWDVMANDGFAWWRHRLEATLQQVDRIRIDHFRGFEAYWEIPADEPTAVKGTWQPGPGQAFFDAIHAAFGDLPIIAEDLGIITPAVEALRDDNRLPGMRVLQFAFAGDASDPYLPHNYDVNTVVYTGTHDNDTTAAWFEAAPDAERDFVRRYVARSGEHAAFDLVRLAFASVAQLAIVPLQDALELGHEARMNLPGSAAGNWSWRVRHDALSDELAARLSDLCQLYGRGVVAEAVDTAYRQSSTDPS